MNEAANTMVEEREEPKATCVGCGKQFKRGVCAGGKAGGGDSGGYRHGSGRYYHFSVCQECAGCDEDSEPAPSSDSPPHSELSRRRA